MKHSCIKPVLCQRMRVILCVDNEHCISGLAFNARLWRQGQESGTVVIQHIITKGTIDERIVKALSKKEMTQTALIDAVKADLEVV